MRRGLLALLAGSLLLAAGCWDRVELEDRGFVIGVAIDMAEGKSSEETRRRPHYKVTYQIVVPGQSKGGGDGGDQGASGNRQGYLNIAAEGDSMSAVTHQLASQTSRPPYFQHLQIIVVSEAVARNKEFASVLDFFTRNHEMRRSVKVMIAKHRADKVLEVNAQNESMPVMYIDSVARNTRKIAKMHPESRIGDLQERLLKHESFTIQTVTSSPRSVNIEGSAIFHTEHNTLVGFLDGEETAGLNFLTDEIRGGIVKVTVDDEPVVYIIEDAKRIIQANVQNQDKIAFTVAIESEGSIDETFGNPELNNPSVIAELERKVEEEIVRLANQTIRKVHRKYKKDVIALGEHIKREHYRVWNKIEKDWDIGRNFFSKSSIEVKAKVKIRSTGVVNKTKRNE